MIQETRYMSINEAAQALHLSVSTVKQWINCGVLLAKTTGENEQLLSTSVDAILAERKNHSIISPVASDVLKIAIVEDDLDLTKLLEMTIHGFEFKSQVHTSTNGLSGLALLCEFRPDVLITDLNMPVMDGFRMINALENSELTSKKLIVTTALSDSDIEDRGGLPKRAIVIRKPFSLNELEDKLKP